MSPLVKRLLCDLDEMIREHEAFLADPAHYTLAPAEDRLERLRAARARLAASQAPSIVEDVRRTAESGGER